MSVQVRYRMRLENYSAPMPHLAQPPGWSEAAGRPCAPPPGATGAEVREHADQWDMIRLARFSDKQSPALSEQRAASLCEGCPVQLACLEAALEEERGEAAQYRHLIRGGMTPWARAELDRSSRGVA